MREVLLKCTWKGCGEGRPKEVIEHVSLIMRIIRIFVDFVCIMGITLNCFSTQLNKSIKKNRTQNILSFFLTRHWSHTTLKLKHLCLFMICKIELFKSCHVNYWLPILIMELLSVTWMIFGEKFKKNKNAFSCKYFHIEPEWRERGRKKTYL